VPSAAYCVMTSFTASRVATRRSSCGAGVIRGVLRGSSEGPQRVLRGSLEGSSEGSQLASTCGEGTVEQSHVSLSCTASTRKPIVLVEVDCSRNCR